LTPNRAFLKKKKRKEREGDSEEKRGTLCNEREFMRAHQEKRKKKRANLKEGRGGKKNFRNWEYEKKKRKGGGYQTMG